VVWWQIVLIVIVAVVAGLGVGYAFNKLIIHIMVALRKTKQRPVIKNTSVPVINHINTEPSVPDLFTEIEFNRRIATKEWTGELQPFQTRAWDNRGDEVHSLAVEIRNELTEAYSDMALANSISWLSTEMSRRSPSLDESYSKLKASVAARLNKVKLQLSEEGLVTETDPLKQ
jgi:hypothetical protein